MIIILFLLTPMLCVLILFVSGMTDLQFITVSEWQIYDKLFKAILFTLICEEFAVKIRTIA